MWVSFQEGTKSSDAVGKDLEPGKSWVSLGSFEDRQYGFRQMIGEWGVSCGCQGGHSTSLGTALNMGHSQGVLHLCSESEVVCTHNLLLGSNCYSPFIS